MQLGLEHGVDCPGGQPCRHEDDESPLLSHLYECLDWMVAEGLVMLYPSLPEEAPCSTTSNPDPDPKPNPNPDPDPNPNPNPDPNSNPNP